MALADELRRLRISKQIPAKEIVAVVQRFYPKFDKTMLSKCEHGDEYGACIQRNVLDTLYAKFAPELVAESKRQRDGRHRLTCRISARLEKEVYDALQQRIRADGYATNQEWVTAMVLRYINGREDEAE